MPFFITIAAGLSAGENLAFPPEGLSLKWYWAVFEVESFRESFTLSMFLAVFGTLSALVLGVPAAYALSRYRLPFAETVKTIVFPGMCKNLRKCEGMYEHVQTCTENYKNVRKKYGFCKHVRK